MPISPLRLTEQPLERNTFQMNRSTALRVRDFRCPKMVQNPFWVITSRQIRRSIEVSAPPISNFRAREELGVEAEIVETLPRLFVGDTSTTRFFLMRYVRDAGKPSSET